MPRSNAARGRLLALAAAWTVAGLARAQPPQQLEVRPAGGAPFLRADEVPDDFKGIELKDRLGAVAPLDVKLTDQDGKPCTLAEKFAGGLPVVLTLNYFDCPMLCKLELQGLVETMRAAVPTLGKEFRVVTVSINPRDNPGKAKVGQERYLKDYDRPVGGERPWEFLVGSETEVRRLADAVGFGYKWLPKKQEYGHHAAIFVCSSAGKLCRVLYGVKFDPATLKLAIVEAADGRIGTVMDKVLMLCYQWDPHNGRYQLAMRTMQIGGGAVALALFGTIAWLLRRDQRVRKAVVAAPAPQGEPTTAATGGRA